MFWKNRNIIFKIKRSKVIDYAALIFQVNLIILQAQESNYCDRCLVEPTNCRKVSGTFGITVMSRGYNPVVDIPVGACYINVTEIGRSQNYLGKIKQVPHW